MSRAAERARPKADDKGRTGPRPFFAAKTGVQARLKMGRPGDRHEREADAAADAAVHARGPLPPGGVAARLSGVRGRLDEGDRAQRTPLEREARGGEDEALQAQAEDEALQARAKPEEEVQAQATKDEVRAQPEDEAVQTQAEAEDEVQTRAEAEDDVQARAEAEDEVQARGAATATAPLDGVERRLRAARGLGNPLPDAVRLRMEAAFGAPLSGVRIHTDALAVQLTQTLRAQAFAHGRDLYFNAGRFAPGTAAGDHLLAHELAHVFQQGAAKAPEVRLTPEDADIVHVRPEALAAIRLARAEIGAINAKVTDAEGRRLGADRLLAYFRTAFGGDVIHPSVIERIVRVEKDGVSRDALPSWCGIFTWWALKTAGVPAPDWKIGGVPMKDFTVQRPPGQLPVKGDIAYRHENQHFALVSGVESMAEAAGKPVASIRIRTVNGNTAGEDNLGGQVQEAWHPMAQWDGFFDPMAKLPPSAAPLVATSRAPSEHEAPPPETAPEAAATLDPGPTDVSGLEQAPAPTAEALPGTAAEIAVEMPEAPAVPPPEPVAVVDKVSLAGSSDAAMAAFAAAAPSAVAATGGELGAALDGKIAAEQTKAAAEAPEIAARTAGDLDPGVTSPDQIALPPGAEIGDGSTGGVPAPLVADPHADKAPPPSNAQAERQIDDQPEGGFLAWLRSAIGGLMGRIRTSDPGVSTSAGARPNVALAGDADPTRMDRQREDGAVQLRGARDAQTQAFRTHPGQSNIAPRGVDETRKPALSPEPASRIAATEVGGDATAYAGADLPKEVRDRADASLAPVLAPGLEQARLATSAAASTRDAEAVREKTAAAEKARQINAGADAEQTRIVREGREDVAGRQAEGVAGAHDQVRQFSDDAATEEGAQRKAVADHVRDEEGKARKELDEGERKAAVEKRDSEKEAADEKKRLEDDQKKDSWWDRAASFVKKAVKAVTEAIDVIFTALREAVAGIIEAAKTAAVGLINKARDWVVDKLNGFRDWAKTQVDKHLREHFPGLAARIDAGIDATVDVAVKAVDLVADTAIAGVEALADGLAAVLDKILSVYQTALKAAVGIAGAVLTGDFAEALKIAIQSTCDIAGIDSAPIFGFFDRAGALVGKILSKPLAFVNNLLSAVGQGVANFGTNILAHLQKGLINWLTGALAETAITLPAKFDAPGIFGLVAQILGLTYDNVKARIIRKFPAAEGVFAKVEAGFAMVMRLKDLDFGGLWEEAKASIGDIYGTVVGAVRGWVVTNVIKEGVIWLLSLLNPASAIVKALKVIFDLVMWLVERFNQIKDFVVSIYEAVAKVAAGVIGPAAAAVENALSRALPVVISMVASVIGLGGVGKAVKGVLEKITAPINKVIDTVIDKVVAYARKIVGGVKKGAQKVKEVVTNFLWPKKTFKDGDQTHTIEVGTAGGRPRLQIRSTPMPAEAFLAAWEASHPSPSADEAKLVAKIKGQFPAIATKIAAIDKKLAAGKEPTKAEGKALLDAETVLAADLGRLVSFNSSLAKGKQKFKLEGLTGTYAGMVTMKGDSLTPDHQPQAKALEILAEKWYFQHPDGAALRGRAAGRAAQGVVINLGFKRHVAGRTYGKQPTEFISAVKAYEGVDGKRKPAVAAKARTVGADMRKAGVKALKTELAADVKALNAVVSSKDKGAKQWSDLAPPFIDAKEPKKSRQKSELMDMIRAQVQRGQAAVAGQPFTGMDA